MTYNIKNAGIIFALAAIMMASPLVIGSAYAETGDGQIDGLCSVTIPANIDLGTITPGADNGESVVSFDTTGSIAGSFEISSTTDWVGLGSKGTGSLLIIGDNTGDTITINGQPLLGGSGTTGAGQFDTAGGTNALQAAALATAINADTQVLTEDFGVGIQVTAHATGNAVLLTAVTRGTGPNSVINIATDNALTATIVTATLGTTGTAAAGVGAATHINAEDVHYEVLTDGLATPPASSYASKSALGATGVNVVLETGTNPSNTIDVYFHFNGVDTTATTTVEVLSGITDGESVTIGATTYAAETDANDVTGTEFLSTGTAQDDATALIAVINAVPNTPDANVPGTATAGVFTIEATRAGSVGNSLTFSQSADGFTLGNSDSFVNGKDALLALPYDGPIAATMTFTADCE